MAVHSAVRSLAFLFALYGLSATKGQLTGGHRGGLPTNSPQSGGSAHTIVSVTPGSSKVQVFHDGTWSYICANSWDNKDAQVVCRMQGYWHGQGTADLRTLNAGDVILIDNMECSGNETIIDQCRFDGYRQHACTIGAVAAVNCDATQEVHVRLVDGFGPWEGRLEVDTSGVWRPVCRTGFDDLDAQVVCRMLGLRTDGGKARTEDKFPPSGLNAAIRSVDCTGAESDLTQCKGKAAATGENCASAGVECYSCGALYTDETGMLQSENYPMSYPRNLNCLYVIRPANDQQLYKLVFNNFSTEACCDKVEVKVLTGSSNLPGGTTYSGTNGPPQLLGKAFAVTFTTDGSQALHGFQAVWSPARVEDVVSVTCEAGHFTVDIDLSFLKRLYPLSSEATIALADPSCLGTIISVGGQDRLVITSETDSCGTQIVSEGAVIRYNNFLVDRVYAQGSTMIVRQRRWEIPIHCTVVRTDDFQVHYNPVPEVGKRSLHLEPRGAPEVVRRSPEVGIAHAREKHEVRGSISVNLYFPVTITAFQDRSYTMVDHAPLSRRLGDDVDLRVQMSGGDSDLKLVLQNCYTTPEPASRTKYFISRNGCAVDSTTEILATQQHVTDFRFTAFEFAGNFRRVYLECDVRVCSANENGPDCTQQCIPAAPPSLGKRSSSEVFGRSAARVVTVNYGPIVIGQ